MFSSKPKKEASNTSDCASLRAVTDGSTQGHYEEKKRRVLLM